MRRLRAQDNARLASELAEARGSLQEARSASEAHRAQAESTGEALAEARSRVDELTASVKMEQGATQAASRELEARLADKEAAEAKKKKKTKKKSLDGKKLKAETPDSLGRKRKKKKVLFFH